MFLLNMFTDEEHVLFKKFTDGRLEVYLLIVNLY